METNSSKRISMPLGAVFIGKNPEHERLSFSIADGESELFAGNGPPHSINQSEYSIIRSLVDKISTAKSPKEDQTFSSANNLAQKETIQKLQQELLDA